MAKDAWGREIWDPKAKPYRFISVRQSSQPGCHGWAYGPAIMFATEEEALAKFNEPMPAGTFKVHVDKAQVDSKGTLIGWESIKTRSRKK